MTPLSLAKRWQDRTERWVAPGELFAPRRYAADVVGEATARPFIERHHYSATYPAARLAVGLYGPGPRLAGVAVFSVPCNERVVPKYTALNPRQGAELGRFVCDPSVRYNGETWFLARAWRLLLSELRLDAFVSYADPCERTTAGGELTKAQHWGTIYQASNALYVGRSSPRWLTIAPDGTVVSPRAISKIRGEERGWMYAARQLLQHGAPAREEGEALRAWVYRAIRAPGFRRVKHPGNLVYVFGLTQERRTSLAELHAGGLIYPKRIAA